MPAPLEFYFDFSSPYAYIASECIEPLAARHGRAVRYRPTLLGAVFRISGQRPLTEIPVKGDYARRDFARSARFAGIPFAMPEPFPIGTVTAARACLVLQGADPAGADNFIHAAFRAYFAEGRNLSDPQVVHDVLARTGADADAVLEAAATAPVKDALKAAVDASLARGVFGTPFIFVDDEPFWGSDRLPQIDRWLSSGPF